MDSVRLYSMEPTTELPSFEHLMARDAQKLFPGRVEDASSPDWLRLRHKHLLDQLGEFGRDDWRRSYTRNTLYFIEQDNYVNAELPALDDVWRKLVGDPKFLAYLDLWSRGSIPIEYFLFKYFGSETHVIFPSLLDHKFPITGVARSAIALRCLLKRLDEGSTHLIATLPQQFPDIYESVIR
jgi:hypothetical protein